MDKVQNICDRIGIGDKEVAAHMETLNSQGFTVVAVHAIGSKFFVFATRVTRADSLVPSG